MDLLKSLKRRLPGGTDELGKSESLPGFFSQYEHRAPAHQNAIDMLPGWTCKFPDECGVVAGHLPLFADDRVVWALNQYGSLRRKSVLEIGPLEGMHTYLLNQHRPALIDAVEANRLCYLRCLVTAQILDINNARFYLGDARQWLKNTKRVYDLIVASGVLYHMDDPANFLHLAMQRCNAIFLWTHFYLDEAMASDDPRRWPFSGEEIVTEVAGIKVRSYERSYKSAERAASFCGGMSDKHYWLHRDDILSILSELGFSDITIGEERLDHPGGPCFSLLARRAK